MLKGVNVPGTKVCSHKTSRADYSAQVFEVFCFPLLNIQVEQILCRINVVLNKCFLQKMLHKTNVLLNKCCLEQVLTNTSVIVSNAV